MMWYSAETRRGLFNAIRAKFPERELPYTHDQMRKIGSCVGVDHTLGLWWLRMDLREVAYETWMALATEGGVQKSTRRDLIENDIVKPADQLIAALSEARKIGATEAFWLSQSSENSIDLSRLHGDLRKFRDWAIAAKEIAMDGSVPKGITVVRQDFVNRLYSLFNTIAEKDPTRNVARGERHYEVSMFSRLVELVAEPVFEMPYDFSTQIREAQDFHKRCLLAAEQMKAKNPYSEKDMEKIRLKISGNLP